MKFQPESRQAFVTVSVYQLTQQNLTTPDPDPTHICGGAQCSVQTGEGQVRGVELEGKTKLWGGLSAIGSFTAMDTEVTASTTGTLGKRLPSVPAQMTSAWVDYAIPDGALAGFGAGVGFRIVGNRYGDALNTFYFDAYTLADLGLRYTFAQSRSLLSRASVTFNVSNLTDKTYITSCSTVQSCFYGTGRVMITNLRYRW